MSTNRADIIKISTDLHAKYVPNGGPITSAIRDKMTAAEKADYQQVINAYKEIEKTYDTNLDGKIDIDEALKMSDEDYNFAHQLQPQIKMFQKPR